jgi:hypothetical protein
MRGTIPLLPLHVFMVSTTINLPFAESQTKWLRNSLQPGSKNNLLSFHKRVTFLGRKDLSVNRVVILLHIFEKYVIKILIVFSFLKLRMSGKLM